jgi:hypothetical protein
LHAKTIQRNTVILATACQAFQARFRRSHADSASDEPGWMLEVGCLWIGFDVDHITSHAAGVGITDEELAQVKEQASALPYLEVRRSTGGKGFHLYCLLDDIPTENHTVHAGLARCVMGMMSADVGFDFARQIDVAGGVMWIWHRKMSLENKGLELLKSAEKILTIDELPGNWRDHIDVVSRKQTKIRVGGLSDEEQDPFDQLASARRIVPLDDIHKEIIDELTRRKSPNLKSADAWIFIPVLAPCEHRVHNVSYTPCGACKISYECKLLDCEVKTPRCQTCMENK